LPYSIKQLSEYHKLIHRQNILCIPHIIKNKLNSRTELMAKALVQQGHKVYFLAWGERKETAYGFSLKNIFYALQELLRWPYLKRKNGIQYVYLPRLVYPLALAEKFNSWLINKYIKKLKIEKVINAAFLYYKIKPGKFNYIYDLVDDHVTYTLNNKRKGAEKLAGLMHEFITGEMRKADKVIFVNKFLKNKFSIKNKKELVIPNGAFFEEYIISAQDQKKKYNLENKYIYGLIGNHGEWSGIKTIIDIFKKYKTKLGNSVLIIAGNVYDKKLIKNLPANIKYLGAIPKENINEIYSLIDCGIQAADNDEFRKMTSPLKVIEYTAAKKIVFALAAENLREFQLPNLIISERSEKGIFANLIKCQKTKWQEEWSTSLKKYDWLNLVKKI